MVIGMRLTGDKDPLEGMTLETRLQLYHEIYPSLPVKNHCACSKESKRYHYFDDYLWKALAFKPMKVQKRVSVWTWEPAKLNNERLADAGLPFSFLSTSYDCVVVNLAKGADTLDSGSPGSYFREVSLVEFDGQAMYRLICAETDSDRSIYWTLFVLPNGIRFTSEPFDTHGVNYNYWFASESIHLMDSVEIYYPERDLRDTVKIDRIETQ